MTPETATALAVALLVAACSRVPAPASDDQARITALEDRIAILDSKVDDLALKGRIAGSQAVGSPVEDFLAADDWWETPYESGQADCARRCIATVTDHRAQCAEKPREAERLGCYADASANTANCQQQCTRTPRPP